MKRLTILVLLSALFSALTLTAAPAPSKHVFVCPECGQECDKLIFDKPGNCPSCGMKLIEKIDYLSSVKASDWDNNWKRVFTIRTPANAFLTHEQLF